MPSLSHPQSSRPQCFHQVYLVIACEWEFLRFVTRWVAPNQRGREKKSGRGTGDICWWFGLVASNPLVVSVAGGEPYLFFFFWIFFRREQKIPSQKICRIFLYFQNYDNSFCSMVFWMDSFSAWAMGCNSWKRLVCIPVSRGIHKSSKRKVGFYQNQVILNDTVGRQNLVRQLVGRSFLNWDL